MKKLFLFIVLLVFISSASNFIYSQDETMKKWMEYMTPGDFHKEMAKGAGTWKVKTKYWMSQGGEANETEGTAVGEIILGGRYLLTKHSGTMMGMPFEGMSIDGYDNATKMFNSVWIDNMGTGMMYMTGKWNEATKSVDYTGKMVDPINGGFSDIRSTMKMNEDGSMSMEMYGTEKGSEYKWMELTMTR